MKKIPSMLIAAVVLVVLATILSRRDQAHRKPSTVAGQRLVPGFEALLAGGTVQTVTFRQGDATTTLALGEDGWVVKELFGYAADFKRLQRVMPSLAGVKIGQVLPGAKLNPAETTVVQWLDASGKLIGGVRLGQPRQGPASEESPWGGAPGGRFVSREGSDAVYLVGDALSEFSADPKSWVDTQLLSIPSTEVAGVEIAHPDGETVALGKEGGDLTLLELAENEEFDTSKRYGVGGALSYLRFAEVADPALDDETTGLASPVLYRATTGKGQLYEARIGSSPEGRTERYARFTVSLAPVPDEEVPEDEDEDAKTARDARTKERAELAKSTAELNAKLAPWTFLISSYNADNMTLRRASLVKEKPKVEPAPDVAAVEPSAPEAPPAPETAPAAEAETPADD